MKQYNIIQNKYPANPRSKKRRGIAQGGVSSSISGGSSGMAGGGSVTVDVELDIQQGNGIIIDKQTEGGLVYTIAHGDTTDAVSFAKVEKKAIAGIGIDDYGHITDFDTCDILILDDLDRRYLRKDMNDTGAGFYTWEAGWMTQAHIRSAKYNIGWEVENPAGWYVSETGVAWYSSMNVRGPILSNNVIGSPYYASGWTGFGSQWDLNKHFLETDFGSFRKEIRAKTFVIDQIRGTNGSLAVADCNKIDHVEDRGNIWRCYIDTYGGDVFMNLRVDDIVRCQRVSKYYLACVTSVSAEYFDLSKTNLEGTGVPEAGDDVLRWDNLSDPDRKGIIYLTSSDTANPYMDVRYGDWNTTVGTIKVRNGRLDGINDPLYPELYGAVNNFGLYTSNFYGTGELILRSTGESVSRTFEVLKDSMTMGFNELREEVYVSPDNVLQNSTFLGGTTDYWEFTNVAYPMTFGGNIMMANGSLFSDLVSGAQIVKDSLNSRIVLQVTNTVVRQRNINFNSRFAGKYAISFSYRPIVPYGSMTVGIEGSTMMVTVPLSDTSKWQRAEVSGDWDGKKDFVIQVTGAGIVNIVDISFADDRITNAIANVKVEYDTKLTLKADQAQLNSFRDVYDEFERVVRRDYATQTWTATKINTEVGSVIDGKLANYSTLSQTSSSINAAVRNLNMGQYATTKWTSQSITNAVSSKTSLEDVKTMLKQTSSDFTISINKIPPGITGITEAFYKFGIDSMQLNRRIEVGPVAISGFNAQGGLSPNVDNILLWGGGPYWQARDSTVGIVLRHDGSGYFAKKNIIWDASGNATVRGAFETSSNGYRCVIGTDGRFRMYNNSVELLNFGYFTYEGTSYYPSLKMNRKSNTGVEYASMSLDVTTLNFGGGTVYGAGLMSLNINAFPKSPVGLSKGTVYIDGNVLKIVTQ